MGISERVSSVAKFDPIIGPITVEAVYQGLIQVHECTEQTRNEANEGLASAKLERQSLRAGQLTMARQIKQIKEVQKTVVVSLDTLNDKADTAADKADNAASAATDAKEAATDAKEIAGLIKKSLDDLNKTAWQAVGAIVMSIFVAGLALGVQAMGNHNSTAALVQHK